MLHRFTRTRISKSPRSFPLLNPSPLPSHLSILSFILPSGSPLHLYVLSWLCPSVSISTSISPSFFLFLFHSFSHSFFRSFFRFFALSFAIAIASFSLHCLLFSLPLSLRCPFSPVSFSLCRSSAHSVTPITLPLLQPHSSLPSISSISLLSLFFLIYIHPLFSFSPLFDICLFIHLSLSASFCPLPNLCLIYAISRFIFFVPLWTYLPLLILLSCHTLPVSVSLFPLFCSTLSCVSTGGRQNENTLKEVIKSHLQRQLHRQAIKLNPWCIGFN